MTLAVKKTPNVFHSPLSTSLTNPIVFVSYFPVMPHPIARGGSPSGGRLQSPPALQLTLAPSNKPGAANLFLNV